MLQPYTFTVKHRKGKANANADALSRMERSQEKREECEVLTTQQTE